jgi:hypothetical protein
MSGIKQGHGRKTHEQILRTLERKDDVPKEREMEMALASEPGEAAKLPRNAEARQSEMAVSRRGMNQESDHHKHNDPGQSGHKPQKFSAANEKHTD